MTRSVVVLPHPLGPRMAVICALRRMEVDAVHGHDGTGLFATRRLGFEGLGNAGQANPVLEISHR